MSTEVASHNTQAVKENKAPVPHTLEEDDEFEDFPVDTWPDDVTIRAVLDEKNKHGERLWEEDWDDVEVEDDFTKELKAELERQRASKD